MKELEILTEELGLINEGRSKPLQFKEALDLAKKNCKRFNWNLYDPIYRGVPDQGQDFLFVDPSKFNRKSANTSNIYTLLFDNYINDKNKFPKRSKSIICTEDKNNAYDYGDAYVVVPFDGARVAYTEANDFWWAFPGIENFGMKALDEFNDFILILIEGILDIDPSVVKTFDWKKLSKALEQTAKTIESNAKNLDEDDLDMLRFKISRLARTKTRITSSLEIIPDLLNEFTDLFDFIEEALDPSALHVTTIDKWKGGEGDSEVWTDSKCLLIAERYISQFERDLR